MIAHFALMGDLYQYDPYDTKVSPWNSYPWQIGAENELNIDSKLPYFTMNKTIWNIDDGDSAIGISNAVVGSFSMFAALLSIDEFGNIGSDVGRKPTPFPYKVAGVIGGNVLSVTSIEAIKDVDEIQYESEVARVTSGNVVSIESILTTVNINSHSETPLMTGRISPSSGTVVNITSTQV